MKMLPVDQAQEKITFNINLDSFEADELISIAEGFDSAMTREEFAQLCADVTGRTMCIFGRRSLFVGNYDEEIPTVVSKFSPTMEA